MERLIRIFHYVSFIKYPILLLGIYFVYKPILFEKADLLSNTNTGLVLMGLGIGIDSLKDYGKLTWLDKKVLHKPKIAKFYFIVLGICILGIIILGMLGYFSTKENTLKELSIGFIVFGIGAIGFLKAGIQATQDYIATKPRN